MMPRFQRPTGEVWVTARVIRRTRRCLSFTALGLGLRERTFHLPLVHLKKEEPTPQAETRLLVPSWWAYQQKVCLHG